jgi:hypothetical protein
VSSSRFISSAFLTWDFNTGLRDKAHEPFEGIRQVKEFDTFPDVCGQLRYWIFQEAGEWQKPNWAPKMNGSFVSH